MMVLTMTGQSRVHFQTMCIYFVIIGLPGKKHNNDNIIFILNDRIGLQSKRQWNNKPKMDTEQVIHQTQHVENLHTTLKLSI